MNSEEKYELITKNLNEVLGEDEIKEVLKKRNLKVYWGTATTGRPHLAYFLPILKIRDFLAAGCEVTILLADIHAFLDNLKAPIQLVNARSIYYSKIIVAMLKSINVDTSKLKLVFGSSFQKSSEYTMDLYRLSTITTERDAKKAGSQVVKQIDNPKLSSLLYPGMQALDEEYLDVDAQFGGVDQRKIFTFAKKYLPLLGYRKRSHLMNPMIDGLNGGKMSSSDNFSKIDLIDNLTSIKKSIKKCFCEEGNTESGLFQMLKYILFPICLIKGKNIILKDCNGCEKIFDEYEKFENEVKSNSIHPGDIKQMITELIEFIINPIRTEMLNDTNLVLDAYPDLKNNINFQ